MESQKIQQAFGTLIETISDTVIITDLEGLVVFWNKGAEEAFGYRREEMVGAPIKRLYPSEELSKVAALRQEVLGGGNISSVELTEVRKQDGTHRSILLSLVPITDEQGVIRWLAGIGKDITPIRELEKKLVDAKQLEAIHQLVVTLNHEMNQPLAVLSMRLQAMAKIVQQGKEISADQYEMVLKQVIRLADLLKQIRGIKRVVSTEYVQDEQMVDINRSLEAPSDGL